MPRNAIRRLSANDHRRMAGLLGRAFLNLRQIGKSVRRAYPASHAASKTCDAAIDMARDLRLQLENAGRSEHPGEGIVYLTPDPSVSRSTVSHGVAGVGEDIGEID